jgi:hypothetical protein
VFGYHVTGSTGTLFLYGIVAGALGLLGLTLLLAGARRTSRRGREARRGLRQSRRETAAASKDRDDLIGQRDTARAETRASQAAPPPAGEPPGDGSPPRDDQSQHGDRRHCWLTRRVAHGAGRGCCIRIGCLPTGKLFLPAGGQEPRRPQQRGRGLRLQRVRDLAVESRL